MKNKIKSHETTNQALTRALHCVWWIFESIRFDTHQKIYFQEKENVLINLME